MLCREPALTQLQNDGGGVGAHVVGGCTLYTCLQKLRGHKDMQGAQYCLWIRAPFSCLEVNGVLRGHSEGGSISGPGFKA